MRTIQMVNAHLLFKKINACIDQEPRQSRPALMRQKLSECAPAFIESIEVEGVIAPVVVMVESDHRNRPRWTLGNGHHRFAVALDLNIEIPVVFLDGEDAYDYMSTDVSTSTEHPNFWGKKSRIPS